jgi:hypothetical protein
LARRSPASFGACRGRPRFTAPHPGPLP